MRQNQQMLGTASPPEICAVGRKNEYRRDMLLLRQRASISCCVAPLSHVSGDPRSVIHEVRKDARRRSPVSRVPRTPSAMQTEELYTFLCRRCFHFDSVHVFP
jgi:hypothetical protein